MYRVEFENRSDACERIQFSQAGRILSYAEVIQGWKTDSRFRSLFTQSLVESSFETFFFETPGVSSATRGQAFELVLIDAPELLDQITDVESFSENFEYTDEGISAFNNYDRDTLLVVPDPIITLAAYRDLASFCRHAPSTQVEALWRRVGAELERAVMKRPGERVWLSTHGGGVAYLHVRLSLKPKHFNHEPFKR